MLMRSVLCMLDKCNRGRTKFLSAIRLFFIWAAETPQLVGDKIHARLLHDICSELCKLGTRLFMSSFAGAVVELETDYYLRGFLPTSRWFEKHPTAASGVDNIKRRIKNPAAEVAMSQMMEVLSSGAEYKKVTTNSGEL
jgi:hypothetical protein